MKWWVPVVLVALVFLMFVGAMSANYGRPTWHRRKYYGGWLFGFSKSHVARALALGRWFLTWSLK